MRSALAAACLATLALAAPAGAVPDAAGAPASVVFTDLQALGFDLAKFHPDYTGRFPYR